jgi:hypothetical protein
MNSLSQQEITEVVSAALAECALTVAPLECDRWSVLVEDGAPRIDAWVWDDWLLLESSASGEETHGALSAKASLELLDRSARLQAGAKLLLTGAGRLLVRAEVPIEADIDIRRRTREAMDGFRAALKGDRAPEVSGTGVLPATLTAAELKELCVETGWPTQERGNGPPTVRLEGGGSPRHAIVSPWGEGARLSVDPTPGAILKAVSQHAVWLFLILSAASLRMVRPAVNHDDGHLTPRFEVSFHSRPAAPELECAFCALSVAGQLCAEELGALQDEIFAGEYLASRGWSN